MAVTKPLETCWILDDKEDIEDFLEYMDNPDDITEEGASLLEKARKMAKEIPLEEL